MLKAFPLEATGGSTVTLLYVDYSSEIEPATERDGNRV